MVFHHIGIACKNIEKEILKLKKIHSIKFQSEIVFDELQNVHLCMLTLENDFKIELVSGVTVDPFIKKGITNYHICYETKNIDEEIEFLLSNGAILASPKKEAILFNGRQVAFLLVSYGLIEILQQ